MAKVTARKLDGKVIGYQVRWRDADGTQRAKNFVKAGDAKDFAATTHTAIKTKTYIAPDAGRETVTDAARRYLGTRDYRPSTELRTRIMIEKHIAGSRLGSLPIGKVVRSDVESWAARLPLAPASKRGMVGLIRAVFVMAVDDLLISHNPTAKLKGPKVSRPDVVPLTPAEVTRIAAGIAPHWSAAVTAQAGLGLRVGELLALRPCDVDFLGRTVKITEQLDLTGAGRVPLKTDGSVRTVPLPTIVAEALAAHISAYGTAPDGRLFPAGRDAYGQAIKRVMPEVTSHDFRHFYASTLLDAGESVVAVSKRLGHTDGGALVLSTYGHLVPGRDERTRSAIDTAMSTAVDTRPVGRSG